MRMRTHTTLALLNVMAMMHMTIGCSKTESERLAEMAERSLQRQDSQNQRMADLQNEVAEGSRRLVEADAQSRQEMIALQRDFKSDQTEVARQRDLLEGERRDLASQRHMAPIIAESIGNIGILIGCILPLVLCWFLLARRVEPADDSVVAEVLLQDLVSDQPVLLPRSDTPRALSFEGTDDELPSTSES